MKYLKVIFLSITIMAAFSRLAIAQKTDWMDSAYKLIKENKNNEAIYICNQELKKKPKSGYAYFYRGYAYKNLLEIDKAIEDFSVAINIMPEFVTALLYRGLCFVTQQEYTKAINDYEQAIKVAPTNAYAWINKGDVHYTIGDYDSAISDAKKSIQIDPEFGMAYINIISAYSRKLQFKEAKEVYEQYKAKKLTSFIESKAEFFKYNLTAVTEDLVDGSLKNALDNLNAALIGCSNFDKSNNKNEYIATLALKGYVLEQLDRHEEAKDIYNQSLAINSRQPDVIAAIKRLTQKQSIVNVQDKTIPTIELISPQASRGLKIVKNENNVEIIGKAKDESGIKSIKVNGIAIAKVEDDGLFITNVYLKEGLNKITVVAIDKNNNTATRTFEINTSIQAVAVKKEDNQIIPVLTDKPPVFYAILIAENDYQDPTIDDLQNPVKDALELKNTLKTKYTFEENNIETLLNKSREEIMQAIVQKSNSLTNNDNLIIFYAGHGIAEKDKFGDVDGYWIPTSAKKGVTSTYISSDDINKALKRSESKHILLIADACFSGAFTRSMDPSAPKDIQVQYNYASRKIMASGNMEPVPDNSKFIYYLNKNLKDNKLKYLTAKDLFNSFYKAVINNTDTLPQYAAIKNVGDEGGEFVFILK